MDESLREHLTKQEVCMSVKTQLTGLMVAMMALSAPMVYADMGPGPEHGDGGWHHKKDYAAILNLSETQVTQLKAIQDQQKGVMKNTFDQLKTNRQAFDSEIAKATPDMSKINDLQAQLKAVQGQMIDNHLNFVMSIKKLMTPEQFAGYMALEKEGMMMGQHKFHKGWRKHDGDKDKDWGKDKDGDDDAK
jgi:Spy/CpxP family protein refolding chaperone